MMTSWHRYLLLQCRDAADPMREHEVHCFVRAMGISPAQLTVVNTVQRLPTVGELAGCSGVLMGGSGDYSSLDEAPWIGELIAFSKAALIDAGKPTFASCFGFQILVRAAGGEIIRDPQNMEFGTYELRLTEAAAEDPIFGSLPTLFHAQVGHHDRAAALPPAIVRFATSDLCPTHAFRIADTPIWATQFHPELRMQDLRLRYQHYPQYGDGAQGATPTLHPSTEASTLLSRFVHWIEAQEPAEPAHSG